MVIIGIHGKLDLKNDSMVSCDFVRAENDTNLNHVMYCTWAPMNLHVTQRKFKQHVKKWAIDTHCFIALQKACVYLSLMLRHDCFCVYTQTFWIHLTRQLFRLAWLLLPTEILPILFELQHLFVGYWKWKWIKLWWLHSAWSLRFLNNHLMLSHIESEYENHALLELLSSGVY